MLIVLNPTAAAGGAGSIRDRIENELRKLSLEVRLEVSQRPGDATPIAHRAADAGEFHAIVAAGGDGTVREVITGVLRSSRPATPVGILPLGTGNDVAHLARTAHLPTALHAVAQGQVEPIDAIEVTCQRGADALVTHALLFAAVGLAADVVRLTTPAIKRWAGARHCYTVGFFRALLRYRPVTAEVVCDGRSFHDDYLLICAGNTSHAGGQTMHLSPGANCRDGMLNVSLIKATTRFEVARRFLSLRRGTHVKHRHAIYLPARDIHVTTAESADVQMDGDNVGTTPARFRVLPGALQLIVARNAT